MELGNKIAYKGFDVDENNRLYCQPNYHKEYFEIGGIKETTGILKLCKNGIHFCWNLNDVHNYYDLRKKVICEVEILGEVINESDMKKSCTNKIKPVRLLNKEEVLKISNSGVDNSGVINSGNYNSGNHNSGNYNSGNHNSGDYNSGDYNSGYYNSGYRNSGDRNSGDRNSGDCNSGYRNSGDRNSGYRNSGDRNSGDCNSGDCNSGDWNKCNYSNGVFGTKDPKISIFNIQTNMTYEQFWNSKYRNALYSSPFILTEWVCYSDEEKENDKAKELIGGYLKKYDYKDACSVWWRNMSEYNKDIVKSMPNFDPEIFYDITGIHV